MRQRKRTRRIVVALLLVAVMSVTLVSPGLAAWTVRQLEAQFMDVKININGRAVSTVNADGVSVEPFIVEGTTYLPVRAVASALGLGVSWDQDNATVNLTDPDVRIIGIAPVAANGDFGAFLAQLKEISGADLSGFAGRNATAVNVAAAANAAAGILNLENALSARNVADAAITAAKAANLLPSSYGTTFTAAELNETAFQVAAYLGLTRGYAGRISDADIFAKLDIVWNGIPAALILDNDLSTIGARLLDEGVATGFSIRNKAYAVNFDPGRTVLYSHSSLQHVKQLVALLNAQGIDARVALDPKTSWYWWEGLQYGPEFDLLLEFSRAADKAKFDNLVLTYAQRADGVATNELLQGSWWTPMYASDTPLDEGYAEAVNHIASFKGSHYYLTSTGPKGALSGIVIEIIEEMGAEASAAPQYTNAKFYYEYLMDLLPAADEAVEPPVVGETDEAA